MTPRRIAMWSGPRNISTAMMRAWENRPDTLVVDEPFYAFYLKETGLDHPGADEVMAVHETDPDRVIDTLLAPLPEGISVFYQKQMSHHLLNANTGEWLDLVTHAFLIRDPREMLASYAKKREAVTAADLGLERQVQLFQYVLEKTGQVPPVIDARDVLMDPRGMLTALCAALDVPFLEDMLSWPAGRRDSDGVWAKHWYDRVEQSTGFAPYRPRAVELSPELEAVAEQCAPYYAHLHRHRLTTGSRSLDLARD